MLSGLLSRGESSDGSSKGMEVAAEVAVDEATEAMEAEIVAMQTTEAVDMPEEAAETVVIDMEGRQLTVNIKHLLVCTRWTPTP